MDTCVYRYIPLTLPAAVGYRSQKRKRAETINGYFVFLKKYQVVHYYFHDSSLENSLFFWI